MARAAARYATSPIMARRERGVFTMSSSACAVARGVGKNEDKVLPNSTLSKCRKSRKSASLRFLIGPVYDVGVCSSEALNAAHSVHLSDGEVVNW